MGHQNRWLARPQKKDVRGLALHEQAERESNGLREGKERQEKTLLVNTQAAPPQGAVTSQEGGKGDSGCDQVGLKKKGGGTASPGSDGRTRQGAQNLSKAQRLTCESRLKEENFPRKGPSGSDINFENLVAMGASLPAAREEGNPEKEFDYRKILCGEKLRPAACFRGG